MRLTGSRALAEFEVIPDAVLVHDPVAAGALDRLADHPDRTRLERELLFRDHPDRERYAAHHASLVRTLGQLVDRVWYLKDLLDDEGELATAVNPNYVFTRDAVITLPWARGRYVRSRMKPPLRRPESEILARALERLGLRELVELPEDVFVEGGDVIPFVREGRRSLLVGFGPRTSATALDRLHELLIPEWADEIIGIELADWRMNLDGGFVPVAEDLVVSDTSSVRSAWLLDARGRRRLDLWEMLGDLGVRVIDTTPEESIYRQSCNCACVGDRRVLYYDLCPRVVALLRQHEIQVHLVPGAELVKGRGGPRCMTRPVYAECSAAPAS